jgi:acetyl-CoA C-acetyltransferase
MTKTVVLAAKRTPIGAFGGALSAFSAPQLASFAIRACLQGFESLAEQIDEVMLGCVLQGGLGQSPARQAAHLAGLPWQIGVSTLNKVCGSGMKTLMLADSVIRAGDAKLVLAGGMESMSNAPFMTPRHLPRFGHGKLSDLMVLDGLEDAYEHRLMGAYAEACAKHYGFSRAMQDTYAKESALRAQLAIEEGSFVKEIVPVVHKDKTMDRDEDPLRIDINKIERLKPAFAEDGTVTAASSAKISDAAATLLLANANWAKENNLAPKAYIAGHSSHSQEPQWFTTAPITAIGKLLSKLGWNKDEVLFEINEAFAVVPMAAMKELALNHARVNVRGGACALGHPLGATGARIVITLLYAMEDLGYKKGIAAACIGGGEATAMALEMP